MNLFKIPLNKSPKTESKNMFDQHMVALRDPDSMAAEQYRILRTHVLKATKENGSRVFLVSSAVHSEGKTLTAVNLAITLVRGIQESALLIDSDLRKPNVSRVLGLKKTQQGLAEYLKSGGDLAKFIIKTSIPKLSLIPSGNPPKNPSELIHSKYMSDLIKEVKYKYNNRYIIIDSPPIIPIADSIILSSLVDRIIIVVKAMATQREIVDEAFSKIADKKKIVGLVLNNCEYSFFKYYSGYYTYYREESKEKKS